MLSLQKQAAARLSDSHQLRWWDFGKGSRRAIWHELHASRKCEAHPLTSDKEGPAKLLAGPHHSVLIGRVLEIDLGRDLNHPIGRDKSRLPVELANCSSKPSGGGGVSAAPDVPNCSEGRLLTLLVV